MIKDEISNHVKQIISEILCVKTDEIDEAELLSNYGLNSVDFIDVVVKLEAQYKVGFDPATMKNLSCKSLAENIEACMVAR